MPFRRVARLVAVVALVCAFLAPPSRASVRARALIAQALAPLARFESGVIRAPARIRAAWASRRDLEEENMVLRRQFDELRGEIAALRGLKEENRRLHRLLDFKESAPLRLLPADVIGRDTRNWYGSIVIDKGTRLGVSPDMPVVAEGGVVGKVIESAPDVSTVILVVDKRSRVGGVVERTRETGVAAGSSFNTLRLDYLPLRCDARGGDRVVTSGLGGVYPPGLAIGEVINVYGGESGLSSCADLSPVVDFSRLEAVFVVMGARGGEGDSTR